MFSVRSYKSSDYQGVFSLYKDHSTFGGQFDEDRDSEVCLSKGVEEDPYSILVCELEGAIIGTISLIENARTAWLFRFAVVNNSYKDAVTNALYNEAAHILRQRGHTQVLVYGPQGDEDFIQRYSALSFEKGADYTCF